MNPFDIFPKEPKPNTIEGEAIPIPKSLEKWYKDVKKVLEQMQQDQFNEFMKNWKDASG